LDNWTIIYREVFWKQIYPTLSKNIKYIFVSNAFISQFHTQTMRHYVLILDSKFSNAKISTVSSSAVKIYVRIVIISKCHFVELIHFLPVKLSNIQQNFEKIRLIWLVPCLLHSTNFWTNSAYLACSLTPPNWAVLFCDKHPLRGIFIEVRCPLWAQLN
jgi:hypothetical protein